MLAATGSDFGYVVSATALVISLAAALVSALQLTRTSRLRSQIGNETSIHDALPSGPDKDALGLILSRRVARLTLRLEEKERPWIQRYQPVLVYGSVAAFGASIVVARIGATRASIKAEHPIFHTMLEQSLYHDFQDLGFALLIVWALHVAIVVELRGLKTTSRVGRPYRWFSGAWIKRCIAANERRAAIRALTKGDKPVAEYPLSDPRRGAWRLAWTVVSAFVIVASRQSKR